MAPFPLLLAALFAVAVAPTAALQGHSSLGQEFLEHQITRPRLFHPRDKREIFSTKKDKDSLEHVHHVALTLKIGNEDHTLDLTLNRDLLPKGHFVESQKNGSHVVHRAEPHELGLCHYQGVLRDVPDSWAALSTCSGIKGVIFDGRSLFYIEKVADKESDSHSSSNLGDHVLFNHQHLNATHKCGYEGTPEHLVDEWISGINNIRRRKRSPELIRGPYNANRRSRFVELVLVVDNKLYDSMNKSLDAVHSHCKDIANIINALYVPLNIFIALVGVVVWTDHDEIELSTKGDTTLTNFLHYRRAKLAHDHPNDNAQLLTKVQFEGGVVGKALKGPICTYEFSGGVSMDHSPTVGLVATTVAHEMGHNFGMEHDSANCDCPDDRCIMAPSSSTMTTTHWSSCSLEYLALAFEHGMDYCLRNKPERLFDSPVCGNGFVEVGEQCDCGLKERCNNPCCNASTCMLYSNASCATGECCDLSTCHPKLAGSMCRSADHECDLPEYCNGNSEYCPADVFKMDGETCDRGKAFCYKGSCRSHTDQCKLLWGPSGKSSDLLCYKMNTKGSRHGNCGYNRLNQSYIKCFDENIYCGMLHCRHFSEKLEFGMESVAILSHSYINSGGSVIPCRTAIVDLGLNEVDPGLAPDGAKCADGKMCVGQRCLPVGDLTVGTACKDNCNGNGVCNSLGHCHCNRGFAPPFCHDPGAGGSEDSGPASHPNARREVLTAFYIVFLGILPSIALVSFLIYYVLRNPFLSKKQRTPMHDKKMAGPHARGGRPNGAAIGKGSRSGSASLEISGPLIVDHSRASLLPERRDDASLQNNLLGQFKGFSITPIQKQQQPLPSTPPYSALSGTQSIPTRPAPPVKQQAVLPPKVPTPHRPAPKLPPVTLTQSQAPTAEKSAPPPNRPLISSPILAATTSCAAKELISTNVPVRPAPKAPSTPQGDTPEPPPDTTPSRPPSVHSSDDKKTNYPTLTRIASFMKGGQKPSSESFNKKDKRPKIDREQLRNLEISNPIPQKDIEIALPTLPAGEKNVVMRAQSMRDNSSAPKRAPIPTFGSMRSAKRPTSIPIAHRPTSPPPRPPSEGGAQPPKTDNPYDDCLNLLTENTAPLAHIDEESPGTKENIYAVIDENPTARRHETEPSEYKVPKPTSVARLVGEPNSDSLGLLGEIVSEIEARNTESIYSASTLKRKKDSPKESNPIESDPNQTYVNTSWHNPDYIEPIDPGSKGSSSSSSSNSGYLSPINHTNKGVINTEVKNMAVPEASAPSYKPYSSSLHRGGGPFASYNKQSSSPVSLRTAKEEDKVKPATKTPLSRKKTPPPVSKPLEVKSKDGKSVSTKPDLVSSCDTSEVVNSPDVLGKQDKVKAKGRIGGAHPISAKPQLGLKSQLEKGSIGKGRASKVASLQQKFEKGLVKEADKR